MKMNFLRSSMRLCALPLSLAVISPAVATEESASAIGVNWVQQKGRTVKVTVKDAAGEIIGANVIVKGTTIGSITDMSGVAVIQDVPNGAILQVSYVGYTTVDVPLKNNQESIVVTLKEDAEALDEVVVVGYGTQAKNRYPLLLRHCKDVRLVFMSIHLEVLPVRRRFVSVVSAL